MMMSPLVKLLSTFPSTVVGKARYPEMPTIRYPIMITMIADTITPSIPICGTRQTSSQMHAPIVVVKAQAAGELC